MALAMVAVAAWTIGTLGQRPLWLDEAFTIANSRTSIDEIARLNGGNMVGYYLLMKPIAWSGESEFWLRIPSVLATVAAIPVVYVLARRVIDTCGARAATVLFATNPVTLAYAREARPYALVVLVSVVSWYALLRSTERSRTRWRWAWVGSVVLGCHLHLLFALVIVPQAMFVVHRLGPGDAWRRFTLPATIGSASLVPLAALAANPEAGGPDWINPLSLWQVAHAVGGLFGQGLGITPIGIGLAAVLCAVMLRSRQPWLEPWRIAIPMMWLLGVGIGLAVVSLYKPLFVERYLLVAFAAIPLLLGLGASALARLHRHAPIVFVLALVLASLPHWDHQTTWEGWDWASARLAEAGPDIGIVFAMPRYRTPIDVYAEWQDLQIDAQPSSPVDDWGVPRRVYGAADGRPVPARQLSEIWLVYRPGRPTETTAMIGQIEARGFQASQVEHHSRSALEIHRFTRSGGAEP